MTSSSKALRTSGRVSVTRRTPPVRELPWTGRIPSRHAEDPAPGIGDWRSARREQPERARLARFRRIQDAVIPQTGGRVVRRSFAIVLLENGGADRLLFFSRQLSSFPR